MDRLQQRDENGAAIIPGSHIKGVLRYQVERLVSSLGLAVLDPHAGSEPGDRELIWNFRPLCKSGLMVDRLFGTRYQGECLFATNAVPDDLHTGGETAVVTRTAIDRVTGTVKEGQLFSTEVVEAGTSHVGKIRGRHRAGVLTQEEDGFPLEYSLLVAALLSLDVFGGDKSTGLGGCEVKIGENAVCWNEQPISVDDALDSLHESDWADWLCILREEAGS